MPIRVIIDSLQVNFLAKKQVLVLLDEAGGRYLPIQIGRAEASAIIVKLMKISTPRPLTHDLICGIVNTLGGRIAQVLINHAERGTYYARIIIDAGGRHLEVDSRPSDAIAIALRANVPIYVSEHVLKQAAIVSSGQRIQTTPEGRITLEQLEPFRDVIEGLDLSL